MRIDSTHAAMPLAAAASRQLFAAAPAKSAAAAGLFAPFAAARAELPASPAASKLRLFVAIGAELERPDQSRRIVQQVKTDLDKLRAMLQEAHEKVRQNQPAGKLRLVFETREKFVDRDITEARNIYEDRDVFETRNVYETRDVYETRNIYETRPVYEQQPIHETHVTGTRDLTGYASTGAADIDVGADLAIQVGNDSTATLQFASNKKIKVTVNGTTTEFAFAPSGGDWRNGLLNALNSISGLTADYASDGKLHLTTSGAQSLTVSDVANELLDFSGSPLGKLGLTAGTTEASVVGYNQVEVGTEQVVVGTEQVLTGTEQVLIGTEQVRVGVESVVVGTENVRTETIRASVGTEQVFVGLERETSDGGTSTADTTGDSPATLQSLFAAIHLRLSDLASLRPPAHLSNGWDKDPVNEIGTILNSLDPERLANPASADQIADGLARIDAARDRADELEASSKRQHATGLDALSTRLGAILGPRLQAPQSDEDALVLARTVRENLRNTSGRIGTGNLLSLRV